MEIIRVNVYAENWQHLRTAYIIGENLGLGVMEKECGSFPPLPENVSIFCFSEGTFESTINKPARYFLGPKGNIARDGKMFLAKPISPENLRNDLNSFYQRQLAENSNVKERLEEIIGSQQTSSADCSRASPDIPYKPDIYPV